MKVTSTTRTRDPITYSAEATLTVEMLVGHKTFRAGYNGDENESRKEVKAEAAKLATLKAGHWVD